MKNSTKRLLVQVGSFTLGAGLIAANGLYVFTKNKPHLTHNAPVVQTSGMEDEITEVSAQVRQTPSGRLPLPMFRFRKAVP